MKIKPTFCATNEQDLGDPSATSISLFFFLFFFWAYLALNNVIADGNYNTLLLVEMIFYLANTNICEKYKIAWFRKANPHKIT